MSGELSSPTMRFVPLPMLLPEDLGKEVTITSTQGEKVSGKLTHYEFWLGEQHVPYRMIVGVGQFEFEASPLSRAAIRG